MRAISTKLNHDGTFSHVELPGHEEEVQSDVACPRHWPRMASRVKCSGTSKNCDTTSVSQQISSRRAASICAGSYGLSRNRPPGGRSVSNTLLRPDVTIRATGGQRFLTTHASLRPSMEPGM